MYPELRNFAFSFEELDITPDQLEEIMGYLPGQSPEPFPEMINSALEKGPELCTIRGSVALSADFTVDKEGGFFSFEDTIFYAEGKMLSQLVKSEGAAIFICTAGPRIGEVSKEIMAGGDFMEGYILDVLGSVTVEAAIEKIQDILISEIQEKGLKVTNRYSPRLLRLEINRTKKTIFSISIGTLRDYFIGLLSDGACKIGKWNNRFRCSC